MTDMSILHQRLTRSLFLPVALGFATASLVVLPSYAEDDDSYGQCVADLTDTGLTIEQASASCAGARFPGTLGECVVDVSQDTGISAVDALEGCERSRRPDEVADCTVDIHQALLEQPSVSALEHCSRSLLPERYGTCVIDLGEEAQLATDIALDRCIRAGYRPWTTLPRQ
ncbi:hypothetical protein IQ260_18490 [Leptolyngbya cf. ectocarpi LEGE 11479]|uniref:Uncharacterized protein n=1 Tax=Leptolyngbya cf. ectocarpi LEGE 11479 TaxID=1828722 RepID=A0A928ZWB4_LEPEC|nr:hypothetical protein [Leptolyngbya ectocarpi]MBE9068637.1 hypothetical protein [Leptolyngbya cf. ectocarpi LEGE 11479]